MTIPFTTASKAATTTNAGKGVRERVSERKREKLDKIRTGDILEGYKNASKGT